ncbi:ribulose-phosphate 3-epimerase [Anaerostipes butyraticus]|uniref:ribulose-phosphate 3-epimerase n=1 Tax=Anaerostipes butyraticus TaxID=645466 RepID=UPI0023A80414|nr:ribulose-phosphate 3-epimerase [Anaerostipes butyraticus]
MKHFSFKLPSISASVSCMDLMNLQAQISECEKAGISFFHYDVVDGKFNRCFILGDSLLESLSASTNLPTEVHLAVYEPEIYIERFAKLGADYIAVQYETLSDPFAIFDLIRKYGSEPVLCYKAETPPGPDFLSLAKEVAWILKLTVNPGFSGQQIQTQAIKHIHSMRFCLSEADLSTPIQADGNVTSSTLPLLASAGANIFTGGSSGLFIKNSCLKKNVSKLLYLANKNTNGNVY